MLIASFMEAGMSRQTLKVMGFALVSLVAVSRVAAAEALDGAYRGMIVCEKMKNSQFQLRAPLDITISGKTALAARPIFNLRGDRVVGSEIATGTVADDGSIKFNSNWNGGGTLYQGNYGGVVTAKGGTFTGTQAWTTRDGPQERTCTAAFVQSKT